ncbi:MAG TPA: transposase family protein [Trebonia sp.]|nr:transposase family protein [Trebonia sp.]
MNENALLIFWNKLLCLEGFHVVHVDNDDPTEPVRLTVIPTTDLALCPHCQRPCETIHRRYQAEPVKDLPLGSRPVDLIIRIYQFACPRCDHYFTPPSAAFAAGAHATERFLQHAVRLIRFSDVANAAAFLGVPEKTLEKWYYDYVERQQQTTAATLQPIRQIGIDELALKKKLDSTSR